MKDAALVASWKQDPVIKHMALAPDLRITVSGQREDIRKALDSGSELYLVIVVKETEEPVGYVRINWMDSEQRQAWLRFALGRKRGKGYAKDALKAFIGYLMSKGAHRIEAEVYEYNHRSMELLASLGFKEEGRKREAHFDGERYRDVCVLGLLEPDFKRGS